MKTIEHFKNKIICGDSYETMKKIPSDSINLTITSPPYFGCRVYGDETIGREENPLDYVANLIPFFMEVFRTLKPDGSFYLNVGDVYFGTKGFSRNTGTWSRKTDNHYKAHKIVKEDGKYLQHKQLLLLPSRIAILMQENGWILRNQIIWEKPNPIPSFSADRRLPVYEYIFHFVKSKKYYFDYDLSKILNFHRDVVKVGIEPFKDHQATFPRQLVEPLILTTSKKGDIVLDLFSGSGTIPYLSHMNGRDYIGIELNENFCKLSEDRIKAEEYDTQLSNRKSQPNIIDKLLGHKPLCDKKKKPLKYPLAIVCTECLKSKKQNSQHLSKKIRESKKTAQEYIQSFICCSCNAKRKK